MYYGAEGTTPRLHTEGTFMGFLTSSFTPGPQNGALTSETEAGGAEIWEVKGIIFHRDNSSSFEGSRK